jgi:hypothetical protein
MARRNWFLGVSGMLTPALSDHRNGARVGALSFYLIPLGEGIEKVLAEYD